MTVGDQNKLHENIYIWPEEYFEHPILENCRQADALKIEVTQQEISMSEGVSLSFPQKKKNN